MKDILSTSFRVYDGMPIRRCDHSSDILYLCGIRANFPNKSYSIGGYTIAYLYDGVMFVMPNVTENVASLEAQGFTRREFFVPFSDGSYPVVGQESWQKMWTVAGTRPQNLAS